MTPFDSWYAANVEPNLPKDFPPQLAKAGKAEAAKVWNAALEVVGRTKSRAKNSRYRAHYHKKFLTDSRTRGAGDPMTFEQWWEQEVRVPLFGACIALTFDDQPT